MAADAVALHEALGGDGDAVLIAHDWGLLPPRRWQQPEPWRRCAILNIPPFQVFGANLFSYEQIKRSFYFWFFQMREVVEEIVSANDFAFIDGIWADWSPGYDASEDLPLVKECLRNPAHFQTALGYYWGQFDPARMGSPEWTEEQEAAWGQPVSQPILYLHGTNDGCHGLDAEQVREEPSHLGEGSESELIEGVGHFMLVERPEKINARILGFLGNA